MSIHIKNANLLIYTICKLINNIMNESCGMNYKTVNLKLNNCRKKLQFKLHLKIN